MNNKILNRVLVSIIGFLLVIILSGTIVGFEKNKGSSQNKSGISEVEPTSKEIQSLNKKSSEKMAAYTGIGRIRAITAASANETSGSPMVVAPWFTYPESNQELYEELSKKRILITGIFSNYFSSHTKEELLSLSEDKIKADLLNEINSQLVLGKIIQLYFTDYLFL